MATSSNSNTAMVSIALCTYNGVEFLKEQLQSIAQQTVLPGELIVNDDASTDGTVDLLKEFASTAPFRVYITENHQRMGATKNFEKAIALTQGEFVFLADQDDIWKPHKIETLLAELRKHPDASYVFSDADLISARGIPMGLGLWEMDKGRARLFRAFQNGDQLLSLLKSNLVTGAALAFRSALKPLLMPISSRWVHDHWIAILGSLTSYGIALPTKLFCYRLHPEQQLGVRDWTIWQRVQRCLPDTPEDYEDSRLIFEDLYKHIAAVEGLAWRAQDQVSLDQNMCHLTARVQTRYLGGVSRAAAVMAEVRTGRYQRFSHSWHSILHDVCPDSLLKLLNLAAGSST